MENKSGRRKSAAVRSFAEALGRFRPLSLISIELGLSYHTVWAWKDRDWVEPGYWRAISRLAARLKIPGITEPILSELGLARSAERLATHKTRRDTRARVGRRPVKPGAEGSKPVSFLAFSERRQVQRPK
jgi:hypothetical protein